MITHVFRLTFILLVWSAALTANTLLLKDNLKRAKTGDYIVTAQGKTYTLLLIRDKSDESLRVEEISVPSSKIHLPNNWKGWVLNNAPFHTSWVMYSIDIPSGQIKKFYSFSQHGWVEMNMTDNFLSTLLNLDLQQVPPNERKKVGFFSSENTPEWQKYWQPKMIFEGRSIKDVAFNQWRTTWPKDGTDLSGKTIEIFIPEENDKYPSYFPYWLQINGMIGKAKIRIIDSGSNLK